MSVYSVKGKGWRYDFTHNGQRLTAAWFKTKKEAAAAEAKRKEEAENPIQEEPREKETPTDMAFLELLNLRLDFVQEYRSERHYKTYVHHGRRWTKSWGKLPCKDISTDMVQAFMIKRKQNSSAYAANQDMVYLKALFNWGKRRGHINDNPVDRLEFFPVEKRPRYVPPPEHIDKVISLADPDTKDYLITLRETLGRMGEINRLTWDDVSFPDRYVILYTRKKKGGILTPRKVPMTNTLFEVLSLRHQIRDEEKPWVFWHSYRSTKTGETQVGPYKDRKKFMRTLCQKAKVPYFRFHAFRHSGASLLDNSPEVTMGSIQRILGHESRRTTEIYLHSMDDLEREAMRVLEARRQKSHTDSHTDGEGATSETRNPLKLLEPAMGFEPATC